MTRKKQAPQRPQREAQPAPNITPERWDIGEDDADGNPRIVDCQDVTIATVWRQELDPPEWATNNAAFILRAVNAHDELVEALGEARDFIDTLLANTPTEATDLLTNHGDDVFERCKAALAKAQGGKV